MSEISLEVLLAKVKDRELKILACKSMKHDYQLDGPSRIVSTSPNGGGFVKNKTRSCVCSYCGKRVSYDEYVNYCKENNLVYW